MDFFGKVFFPKCRETFFFNYSNYKLQAAVIGFFGHRPTEKCFIIKWKKKLIHKLFGVDFYSTFPGQSFSGMAFWQIKSQDSLHSIRSNREPLFTEYAARHENY